MRRSKRRGIKLISFATGEQNRAKLADTGGSTDQRNSGHSKTGSLIGQDPFSHQRDSWMLDQPCGEVRPSERVIPFNLNAVSLSNNHLLSSNHCWAFWETCKIAGVSLHSASLHFLPGSSVTQTLTNCDCLFLENYSSLGTPGDNLSRQER